VFPRSLYPLLCIVSGCVGPKFFDPLGAMPTLMFFELVFADLGSVLRTLDAQATAALCLVPSELDFRLNLFTVSAFC
jgi:hypothetical protein